MKLGTKPNQKHFLTVRWHALAHALQSASPPTPRTPNGSIPNKMASLLRTALCPLLLLLVILLACQLERSAAWMRKRCPKVHAIRNFDLESMMGCWYVVQYYASTEELPEYACMRSHFTFSSEDQHITMNFTYIFAEDPLREQLQGNITWLIPEFNTPAHWVHTEDIYEGIYNTYVLDTDYKSWGLIMHCAEKKKHSRYLSALLLSREPTLGENVINFLREKLPRYDIDLSFLFAINQTTCDNLMVSSNDDPLAYIVNGRKNAKEMFRIMKSPNNRGK